jgi:hypothetical protein
MQGFLAKRIPSNYSWHKNKYFKVARNHTYARADYVTTSYLIYNVLEHTNTISIHQRIYIRISSICIAQDFYFFTVHPKLITYIILS